MTVEEDRAKAAVPDVRSIVTEMEMACTPAEVWDHLMFFEQIATLPPIALRLVLPTPVRLEGCRSHVGDETHCVYVSGHLRKRVTIANPGREFAFEVIEQSLLIGNGIALESGGYRLHALASGGTRVALETCYRGPSSARWPWRVVEALVGHAFHRHILRALRRSIQDGEGPRSHAPGANGSGVAGSDR